MRHAGAAHKKNSTATLRGATNSFGYRQTYCLRVIHTLLHTFIPLHYSVDSILSIVVVALELNLLRSILRIEVVLRLPRLVETTVLITTSLVTDIKVR
jgi:hypothetical protein